MQWKKLGCVFCPSRRFLWMHSHAAVPIAYPLGNHLYRIYFSCRDQQNRSYVGYVELDIRTPSDILNLSPKPVLEPGPLGNFDDHGVYASCLVEDEDKLYLYYLGWNPGVQQPLFYSAIGLAVSTDQGKTFVKTSKAPIMARSEFDPWTVLLPNVMKDKGIWRMWYGSGLKWEETSQGLHSYYHIKYAESIDGVQWKREGHVCIELKENEKNVAHPFVLKTQQGYLMWYSYNSDLGYRIGFAKSKDGYQWQRQDDCVGIQPSASGWDCETLSHPFVVVDDGIKYLLYNGNSFGRTGFGIAVEQT